MSSVQVYAHLYGRRTRQGQEPPRPTQGLETVWQSLPMSVSVQAPRLLAAPRLAEASLYERTPRTGGVQVYGVGCTASAIPCTSAPVFVRTTPSVHVRTPLYISVHPPLKGGCTDTDTGRIKSGVHPRTPIEESYADLCSCLEELQRLLREPSRDAGWMARWHESHERWRASHARYELLMRRRN